MHLCARVASCSIAKVEVNLQFAFWCTRLILVISDNDGTKVVCPLDL